MFEFMQKAKKCKCVFSGVLRMDNKGAYINDSIVWEQQN